MMYWEHHHAYKINCFSKHITFSLVLLPSVLIDKTFSSFDFEESGGGLLPPLPVLPPPHSTGTELSFCTALRGQVQLPPPRRSRPTVAKNDISKESHDTLITTLMAASICSCLNYNNPFPLARPSPALIFLLKATEIAFLGQEH